MRKVKTIILLLTAAFLSISKLQAQTAGINEYFNISSDNDSLSPSYGSVKIDAGKKVALLNTIIAYGENVKSLNIRINNGFAYKLAPAQSGQSLNYFGSSMNIVLQPGDKAIIEFVVAAKGNAVRHIFISGQKI